MGNVGKFGKVKLKVLGLNLDRFLTNIQNKKIVLTDVIKIDGGIVFWCYLKNYKQIKRLAKILRLEIKVLKNNGLKGFFYFLLRNLGIILACVFWFVFSLWFSFSHVFVRVSCEDDYETSEIESLVLSDYKSGKTLMEIERDILVNFSDINSITIEKNGVYLDAKITTKKTTTFKPIVAPCDAKIISIDVLSGKQVFSVNQLVKKGDIIVDVLKLDNGQFEPAKAEITLSGWVSKSEFISSNKETLVRTGKSFKSRAINISNYDLIKAKQPEFKYYEIEEKSFFISPNSLLPLKIVEYVYYELEMVETKIDVSLIEEETKQICLTDALSLVPDGATNISEKTIFEINENGGEATTFVKFELKLTNN